MTFALVLETTLRTVGVAALAGLGLALFQVRSSTIRLVVWRLVLYASLIMPFASPLLTKRAIVVPPPAPVARAIARATSRFAIPASRRPAEIDWQGLLLRSYALVAGVLLLRAALGFLRLRQLGAHATHVPEIGPEVFETLTFDVPVTYGVRRPRILLPRDWRNWPQETLAAVLAHERAHIAGGDFLTQCLSKVNRALYWMNPLAWWIDRHLAQLAEHLSDDAALNRVSESPMYASILLRFAERRSNYAAASGVAMARPGGVADRIDRILDEAHKLSQPLSRLTRLALGLLAFVAVFAIGACKMSTVAAQTNPPKPQQRTDVWWTNSHNLREWVLVSPQGTSMNGGEGTLARAKSFVSSSAGDYLWFTRDGQEYIIDDPKALAEIQDWMKPMEELGHQQGELGEKQSALGEQMAKLGEEMAKLGDQMSHVKVGMPDMKKLRAQLEHLNKLTGNEKQISLDEVQNLLGELQSQVGEVQAMAGDKQSKLGELQAQIGEKQGLLGEKQGALGELQGRLGEQQSKIAEEAEHKLRRLFDQTLQDGRAKPVR